MDTAEQLRLAASEIQNLKLLLAVLGIASPLFVGLLSWFVKVTVGKTLTKFDNVIEEVSGLKTTLTIQTKDMEILSDKLKGLSHIGNEWPVMKERLDQGLIQIKDLKTSLEDVVILKRDQKTMWKRIDENREDIAAVRSELRGVKQ